ncbi:ABC transporter permease [Streptomyces sp. PCS3-D2]|uniref:hypothetical protein n=1 Tax=Streptomyces sp. PCS3-D2 TaxID=1460244 RepID=UPI000447ED51|nr:hypothetical protein [Streptomyces sp. PCS3-D2]WKV70114.1 ABC transporter permease [Streptomyces sp. PCS3-D2]
MTSTATLPPPGGARPDPGPRRPSEVDNRAAYAGFGLAYLLGHGAAAASHGDSPLLGLPAWLPTVLLGAGLVTGIVLAAAAALRAQRGAPAAEILSGTLLGTAWIAGFAALALAITGLTSVLDAPELQTVLWPAGSGIIVGLLYLAEGAVRRNVLHYCLGIWLALTSAAVLFLEAPRLHWALATACGGAYALATFLEARRLRSPAGPARD